MAYEQLVPEDAYQIRDPEALPQPLKAALRRPSELGRVWACWATNEQTWLFTCRIFGSMQLQRSVRMHVRSYDAAGHARDWGYWLRSPQQGWQRSAD